MKHEKPKEKQRYKQLARTVVTTAAVVTIGTGIMAGTVSAHAGAPGQQRTVSLQRKAPAWRVGLRAAEAKVLGMTPDKFKEARRDKKLSELVAAAGLTPDQFAQKVKYELTAEWKAKGVSDKEIQARLAKLAKFQNRQTNRIEKGER